MTPASSADAVWCKTALLPGGWAQNVRISVSGGKITGIEVDASPAPSDARLAIVSARPVQPAQPCLPARHGRSDRGRGRDDSFWTWRDLMYRFVERLDPEAFEAIAALAMSRCWRRASPAWASSTTCTTRPMAAPTTTPARWPPPGGGRRRDGPGPDPAAGVLRPQRLRRRAARRVSAASSTTSTATRGCSTPAKIALDSLPDAVLGVAPHSLRAATMEEVTPSAPHRRSGAHSHRRTDQGGGRLPSPWRKAAGSRPADAAPRWTPAGAWSTLPT
jgi:formimidoylglutamate deiminase